jgi:hypothetical protein
MCAAISPVTFLLGSTTFSTSINPSSIYEPLFPGEGPDEALGTSGIELRTSTECSSNLSWIRHGGPIRRVRARETLQRGDLCCDEHASCCGLGIQHFPVCPSHEKGERESWLFLSSSTHSYQPCPVPHSTFPFHLSSLFDVVITSGVAIVKIDTE